MDNKNKISVRIHGSEYTLISSESVEYMQKIANYVDRKMTEITQKNSKLSTALAGVLAALNIADELHKKDNTDDELRDEIIRYAKEFKELNTKFAQVEIENANLKREVESLRAEVATLRASAQNARAQSAYQKPQQHSPYAPKPQGTSPNGNQPGAPNGNSQPGGGFNVNYNK